MGATAGVSLIKLGGSLITDKRREKHARSEVIARLAGEIAELRRAAGGAWIVGHGSGSFGHVEAHRHEIHRGLRSDDQLAGVAATADEAARLHRMVLGALRSAGEAPFSFAPSSGMVFSGGEPASLHLEPLRRSLDAGLLPVAYGDVVMDREQGCAICSTETLFVELVAAFQDRGRTVERVFWLGETDGIYGPDGETVSEISEVAEVEGLLERVAGASGVDVTGGIRHRLSAALELATRGVSSWIGNGLEPGLLGRAVSGETSAGTWVRA